MKSIPFTPLEPGTYREIVRRALAEDLGWGDVTTEGTVAPQQRPPVGKLSDNVMLPLLAAAPPFDTVNT